MVVFFSLCQKQDLVILWGYMRGDTGFCLAWNVAFYGTLLFSSLGYFFQSLKARGKCSVHYCWQAVFIMGVFNVNV